jgi:hypothetical protein
MTHQTFMPGDRVRVSEPDSVPFESTVLAQWGRIVAVREPGTGHSEVQVYARFVEAVSDYEVDAAELLRLAQLADEWDDTIMPDDAQINGYKDGMRDVLRYLAGQRPNDLLLLEILEVNPDLKPRLTS